MGTSSKLKVRKNRTYRSGRMIKEWCQARGIDFATHMKQFPLLACNYNIPIAHAAIEPSLWAKVKDYICRVLHLKSR